jgi:hypothetical protein
MLKVNKKTHEIQSIINLTLNDKIKIEKINLDYKKNYIKMNNISQGKAQ